MYDYKRKNTIFVTVSSFSFQNILNQFLPERISGILFARSGIRP